MKKKSNPTPGVTSAPKTGRGLGHAPVAPADDRQPAEALDAAHRVAVDAGLEQARLRRYASDAEVEAVFRRFGS